MLWHGKKRNNGPNNNVSKLLLISLTLIQILFRFHKTINLGTRTLISGNHAPYKNKNKAAGSSGPSGKVKGKKESENFNPKNELKKSKGQFQTRFGPCG